MSTIYVLTSMDGDYDYVEALFSSEKEAQDFIDKFGENNLYDIEPFELDYWVKKKEEIKDCFPYSVKFYENEVTNVVIKKDKFHATKDKDIWFSKRYMTLEVTLFAKNGNEAVKEATKLKDLWLKDLENSENVKDGWLNPDKYMPRLCF